jgi:hypothetical protein
VITPLRGTPPRIAGKAVEVVVIDDDDACASSHPRTAFAQALESAQVSATIVETPSSERDCPVCVALFGELRGDRHQVAYRPETLEQVAEACDAATRARRDVVILLFAAPSLAGQIRGSAPIVCGWSGDRCMQEAVARWLVRPPS